MKRRNTKPSAKKPADAIGRLLILSPGLCRSASAFQVPRARPRSHFSYVVNRCHSKVAMAIGNYWGHTSLFELWRQLHGQFVGHARRCQSVVSSVIYAMIKAHPDIALTFSTLSPYVSMSKRSIGRRRSPFSGQERCWKYSPRILGAL